jgi:hypothetical protein
MVDNFVLEVAGEATITNPSISVNDRARLNGAWISG